MPIILELIDNAEEIYRKFNFKMINIEKVLQSVPFSSTKKVNNNKSFLIDSSVRKYFSKKEETVDDFL